MEIGTPIRRQRRETILPMINVVFLLLIFFLMTVTMTPPEVSEVSPPESASGEVQEIRQPLVLGADGRVTWGKLEGEEALAAIEARWAALGDDAPELAIHADRDAEGAALAALVNRLAEAGVRRSALVTGGGR